MDKKKFPAKSRLIFSSSPPAPPPSPIPTAKGSRSAADPILSEYIDECVQIPELILPHYAHRFKPEEIDYELLVSREKDSVSGLLRSVRDFGVVQIIDHGILTEELKFALANCERIFGLTVGFCTSYGDHEEIVWRGDDDQIMEEAPAVIGEQNFRIFRQKIENVAGQLEAIAEELVKVIAQSGGNQIEEPIQLGESTLNIYRYHRANTIDRNSPIFGETSHDQSGPYALSLHLLLESSEICLKTSRGNWSYNTSPNAIVVTIGKELEKRSREEFKSAQGKLLFKPFLHTSRPSFSIERKWSASNTKNVVGEPNRVISLRDQFLVLVFVTLGYNYFAYIFS